MPEDTAEGVKDRLARRFDGEDGDTDRRENDESTDTTGETGTRSDRDGGERSGEDRNGPDRDDDDRTERPSRNEESSKKAKNVKKEWKALSFYLPDELEADLSRTYKRLDWELEADRGISIKKTRHYYPLVVELGLERIEEMDSNELEERIESF